MTEPAGPSSIAANAAYLSIAEVASKIASVALYVVMAREVGAPGFGVYTFDHRQKYYFVDGRGPSAHPWTIEAQDLGDGPGSGATDARVPELGDDVTLAMQSKISMSEAPKRKRTNRSHGRGSTCFATVAMSSTESNPSMKGSDRSASSDPPSTR